MSTPAARLKDLPVLAQDGSNLKQFADALREAMQTYRGYVGDPLDKGLTLRDARTIGLIDSKGNPLGGGTPGAPGLAGPPGPPGGSVTPDLTPPPSPTGLAVTSGFANLFISWTAPSYSVGHGHKKTNIYGATHLTGDPLPTFASAVRIGEAWDARTLYVHASDLGVNWSIWIKFESNDGVESVSPAGGANGAQTTIGKVGTSDLGAAIVLSANLAPGSVTADKAALDIGGDNLLANNSFEVDANGDNIADGWNLYNNTNGTEPAFMTRPAGRISGQCQRVTWVGTNTSTKGVYGDNVRGGWRPGATYVVSWYARADAAKASGTSMQWNTAPATTVTLKNPNLATTWQRYAYRITMGGSVEGAGRLFMSIIGGLTGYIEFDDAQVEEGDTLSGYQGKLALNTIVAGDGAIANLAITNALIGTAAVDDAKIANLSAAKLSVGTGIIGGNLMSANFVSGVSGWLLQPNGNAEFSFANIRGTLLAGQIVAGTATVASEGSVGAASFNGAAGTTATSGIQNLFSLVTTGAPVIVAGSMYLSASYTGGAPVRVTIRAWLCIDGAQVKQVAAGTHIIDPSVSTDVDIGVAFRTTALGAGSHTYGWQVTAVFNSAVTIPTVTAAVNLFAQENKV